VIVIPTLRERLGTWLLGRDRDTFANLFTPPEVGRRAVLPEWFYMAPYGQPRNVNITRIRELASAAFIQLCVGTIVDEFAQAPWNIVPKDRENYSEQHIEVLTNFFLHPNENQETLSDIRRKWARDLLITDAAVIVKVFDEKSHEGYYSKPEEKYIKKGKSISVDKRIYYKEGPKKGNHKKNETAKLTFYPLKPIDKRTLNEIYCVDGSTFLADGDYTGFIHRWFQYSWKIPRREPFLFDRDEIVYTMKNPRSYSFYGFSPIQSLESIVRTLKAQVLNYEGLLKEKGVPEGILSFIDISDSEIKRLREYWRKEIRGKQRKFAVIGREAKFIPIQVTSKDLEMLQVQKWFMKLIMSYYDLNIPILSLHGRAPRAGTEALVEREKRKAVLPLLHLFEEEMNNNIVTEFEFDDVEFKFDTFDIAEALHYRQMYWKDVQTGLRTINEIRTMELGLDPVEWGDEPMPRPARPFSQFREEIQLMEKKGVS